MSNFYNKYKINIYSILLISLVILCFFRFGFRLGTDDSWFKTITSQHSIIDYLIYRYNTWSARIIPEFFLYYIFKIPLIIFQILNVSFMLFLIYGTLKISNFKLNIQIFSLILIGFGFLSFNVIDSSIFWMTGAVNYLWPAAIGMFTMSFYADYFYNRKQKISVFSLFTTIIFSLSNEQFLLCGIGVAIVFHVSLFIKKRKQSIILLINSFILIFGFTFMYLAPGNKFRMSSEVAQRMPDFYTVSTTKFVRRSISWLYDGWHTHLFFILIAILIISFFLIDSIKKKTILTCLTIGLFTLQNSVINLDMNFNLLNKDLWIGDIIYRNSIFSINVLNALFPYIIYTIFLGTVIYFSVSVSKNPVLISFYYLAAFASSALMWFSPTIYASGSRVFFAAGIFLLLVFYNLLKQYLDVNKFTPKIMLIYSIYPIFNLFIIGHFFKR